ncbi:MAG: PAS domain-containing protein [Acidobacteria bacterium]|nr:PAS domain-containing protein [Acidobacteriota bacterium]
MNLLLNPVVMRLGMLLMVAIVAFVLGAIAIRHLRKSMVTETASFSQSPMSADGLPIHSYHAVIQQLKQQKHELTALQQADRRKAKASDTLSATVLANLSCGVMFFNASGLVRHANAMSRQILGFASPVGLRANELFRNATLQDSQFNTIDEALAPAVTGESVVRGLVLNYISPDGAKRVLDLTVSPVLGEDASLMGTTFVLTDRTEIARIRQDQEMRQEVSAEMALELRGSLTTIAGYAQQLAHTRDNEMARQIADDIASEAAQLDRTIGSFLSGSAKAASTSS